MQAICRIIYIDLYNIVCLESQILNTLSCSLKPGVGSQHCTSSASLYLAYDKLWCAVVQKIRKACWEGYCDSPCSSIAPYLLCRLLLQEGHCHLSFLFLLESRGVLGGPAALLDPVVPVVLADPEKQNEKENETMLVFWHSFSHLGPNSSVQLHLSTH